jgi:ADP-ribose pyrophosphatase YjhB (NUDIX family)
MIIRIYFNTKVLYLTSEIAPQLNDFLHRRETIFMDELSSHSVDTMIHQMQQDDIYQGVLLHPDVPAVLSAFKNKLTSVIAAGGFVLNTENQVLLIFRREKWDLPKGKLDEGETIEACAVREVQEETGVDGLSVQQPLTITYHTYREKNMHILKESHWFLMKAAETKGLIAQTEEDIEECRWVSLTELHQFLPQMHSSIRDVIEEGTKALETSA